MFLDKLKENKILSIGIFLLLLYFLLMFILVLYVFFNTYPIPERGDSSGGFGGGVSIKLINDLVVNLTYMLFLGIIFVLIGLFLLIKRKMKKAPK